MTLSSLQSSSSAHLAANWAKGNPERSHPILTSWVLIYVATVVPDHHHAESWGRDNVAGKRSGALANIGI